jgi:hypothetical protein
MDSNTTKSGEPNIPNSQENIPTLCTNGCGFFGSPDKQNMCSVCFKKENENKKENETEKKENKSRASTPESSSGMTDAMASLMKPGILSPQSPSTSETTTDATTPTTPELAASSVLPAATVTKDDSDSQPPAKKQKKKCGVCKKKLGLTGFECRCGLFYCGIHRYSDQHNCPFDYKSDGRKLIAAQNPACRGEKINKL